MKYEGKIEFTVLEQSPEQVISELPIHSGIRNPYGIVHAGAILWFADVTASILALGSTKPTEGMLGFPLAVTLNANFTGNQKDGTLKAIASYLKKGKTITIIRTTVTGEDEMLIADITTNHVMAKHRKYQSDH